MPSINITILNVTKTPAMSKANKPYEFLDIAYKNNTWQGKVEGKKLMPFGENANAFAALKDAQTGQSFDVTVVKNTAGFNDWTHVAAGGTGAQQNMDASQKEVYQPQAAYGPKNANTVPARTNTFETPAERAQRQVYIVRQSSLSAAINTLTPGAKSSLKPSEVIELAKDYEAYVFAIPSVVESATGTGFDDMDSDVPE